MVRCKRLHLLCQDPQHDVRRQNQRKTEYRQININPSTQEGPVLGYLYITQDEADNFRLVSTSFNEIPLGETR